MVLYDYWLTSVERSFLVLIAEMISIITNDGRNIVVSLHVTWISSWMCFLAFILCFWTHAYLSDHNDLYFIQGILKGFDQATNIILDESHERVFSTKVCIFLF